MASQSTINVVKAFTLTIVRDGQLVKLRHQVGIQDVDDDVADHWYTKAHCGDLPQALTRGDTGGGKPKGDDGK